METNENNNRLTDEQRELAALNHNLIYSFAHKNNINVNNYYGVLAIGLCKAAKAYSKKEYAFPTLAFKCMENELNSYKRKQIKQSVIPESLIVSYDATVKTIDGYDMFISDYIADNNLNKYELDGSTMIEFANSLTREEKIIVNFLLDGMTQTNIAKILGYRQQNVNYRVGKIREKAKKFLYNY